MNLNKYIGIPFVSGGREYSGCDCWGLARLFYKDELNIDLPSFSSEYTSTDSERMAELIAQYQEGWASRAQPEVGDLLLFRVFGVESHIGIYIGGSRFIHSIEGYASAVQSLESPEWKKRFVGAYTYSSGASLVAVPHPLKTIKHTTAVPAGTTVGDLKTWIQKEYNISSELDQKVIVFLNGQEVSDSVVIKDSDTLEYRALPGKSALRLILTIAIMYVGYTYFGISGMTGFKQVAAMTALSTATQLLVNAIVPIRPPESRDPGTPGEQYLLSGGQNQPNRYSTIPVVLGKVRLTPPLAANTYSSVVDNNDTYLHMLLCWGYGPVSVSDIRLGTTRLTDFDTTEKDAAGNPISSLLAYTYQGYSTETAAQALAAYGNKDVEQYYSGVKLTSDGTNDGSPWVEYTFDQEVRDISVAISFPQGLRRLAVKGSNAGKVYGTGVQLEIQYRSNIDLDWRNIYTYSLDSDKVVQVSAYPQFTNSAGQTIRLYTWYTVGLGPNGIVIVSGCPTQNINEDPNSTTLSLLASRSYSFTTGGTPSRYGSLPSDIIPLARYCTQILDYSSLDGLGENTYTSTWTAPGVVDFATFKNSDKYYYSIPNVGMATGEGTITIYAGYAEPKDATTEYLVAHLGIEGGLFYKRKDPFIYTTPVFSTSGLAKRYSVRVRRRNTDEQNPGGDDTYQNYHDAVLYTITGSKAATNIVVNPKNCKLALTGLKIKATDNINGSLEGINALVQTVALDYTGGAVTGRQWVQAVTNNPASLFRYILEHPASAQRVTNTSKLDLAAIERWHYFCQVNGYQYNGIVAEQKSLLEVLRDVCAAGRASPMLKDGKWTVVVDEPRNIISQHFTPHNSWGFESTKQLPRQPHAFRVVFQNERKSYQQDEIIVPNVGYTNDTAELFEELQFPGVTTSELAVKHARWHLAQLRLRPEVYTINTDMEYLVCNRGDLVRVSHDVPMWGTGTGRISGLSTNSIRIDEPVLLDQSKVYRIRVRTQTGASVVKTLVSVTSTGVYSEVFTTSQITENLSVGDLFIIGETSKESQELVVLSVEPFGDKNAKITLTDYSPEIYTLDLEGDSFYPPVYQTDITLPAKNLIKAITLKPTIIDIVSDESVLTELSPGNFRVNMRVFVAQQALSLAGFQYIEVQAKLAQDNSPSWPYRGFIEKGQTYLDVSDLIELEEYSIRARFIGEDTRTGPWSSIIYHTVVGKTSKPSQVSTPSAEVTSADGVLKISWPANLEKDIAGYEVRTSDIGWGNLEYVWKGNSTSTDLLAPAADVATRYYVKAYDYSLNYSSTANYVDVNVAAPGAVRSVSYKYSDTSNTNSNITVKWLPPEQGSLSIAYYTIEVIKPIFNGITPPPITIDANTTSVTVAADWVGSALFKITAVDIRNNTGALYEQYIQKQVPGAISSLTAEVVDNNVLLRWSLPETTSLPISHVLVKRGPTWQMPDRVIGEKDGTFTSVFELQGGSYLYWVAAVDTDSREGEPLAIPVTVSSPPDFVFNGEYTSELLSSDITNAVKQQNDGVVMLVNTAETFEQHFTSNAWTSPNDQVSAGYPIYAQPGILTSTYREVFDVGTVLGSSSITVSYLGYRLFGNAQVYCTIETSVNNVDWSPATVTQQLFTVNFRYVRVTITATQNDPGDLYVLTQLNVRLDNKQISDSGNVVSNAADALGTSFNFNKEFIDVTSITVSPNATVPVYATYNYTDEVIESNYSVTSNECTVVDSLHQYVIGDKVRLQFITGTGISGVYTVYGTSPTSYTVSMNTSDTSGTVSTYSQTVKVLAYDTSGNRTTVQISLSIRGY